MSDREQVRLRVVSAAADPDVAEAAHAVPGRDPEVVATQAVNNYAPSPDGDLERVAADQQLVEVLAASGFAGPLYDRFRDELAKYAVTVLCGWMRSGYVFQLASRHGFALHPTAAELDDLQRDSDLRMELAVMIVAVALRRFRERVLVGGGWRADGGASLTTYFTGACLSVFPNEFRRYRSQKQRWQSQDAADPAVTASPEDQTMAPEDLVAGTMGVRERLARMDQRTQAIVALRMDGYRQEEIAEILGEKSGRAVEGVLYRLRVKEGQRARREVNDSW